MKNNNVEVNNMNGVLEESINPVSAVLADELNNEIPEGVKDIDLDNLYPGLDVDNAEEMFLDDDTEFVEAVIDRNAPVEEKSNVFRKIFNCVLSNKLIKTIVGKCKNTFVSIVRFFGSFKSNGIKQTMLNVVGTVKSNPIKVVKNCGIFASVCTLIGFGISKLFKK